MVKRDPSKFKSAVRFRYSAPNKIAHFGGLFLDLNIRLCYNDSSTITGNTMFESLEIRKAANGFILIVHTEDDTKEYVYDTERKLMRQLKSQLGEKITAADAD